MGILFFGSTCGEMLDDAAYAWIYIEHSESKTIVLTITIILKITLPLLNNANKITISLTFMSVSLRCKEQSWINLHQNHHCSITLLLCLSWADCYRWLWKFPFVMSRADRKWNGSFLASAHLTASLCVVFLLLQNPGVLSWAVE